MEINDIYKYAENENIKVKSYNFNCDYWKGQCIYDKFDCIIYLNSNISDRKLEKCTLAHEIGHYKQGIIQNKLLSTSYRDTLIRSVNDFRANKWAISKLIPFDTFKRFLDRNMTKFEVSEELEVTEEFVELACYIYEPLIGGTI